MSVKPEVLFGYIQTVNVFHPVKAKNLNFNSFIFTFYIINIVSVFYFQNTFANFQVILHSIRHGGVSEQPNRLNFALNAIAIRDRRRTNMSIQTTSLPGIDVAPAMGVAYGHLTSECFHREMKKGHSHLRQLL